MSRADSVAVAPHHLTDAFLGWLPAGWARVAALVVIALIAHVVVALLRSGLERLSAGPTMEAPNRQRLQHTNPKVATVGSLTVSALTFTIYFTVIGLILSELGVNPTTYFATATVVGLAVGFGSQGLVQDVVIGLTLVFSDVADIGDVVEIAGQVGRVDRMGLRFTSLVNHLGQTVFIPNRNIAVVGRYRNGHVRMLMDVQVPAGAEGQVVEQTVRKVALGVRSQLGSLVLRDPELVGVRDAEPGGWRYVRVKLRVWPGQTATVETAFRQRVVAALKDLDPAYSDWMVTASYRVL